MQGMHRCDRGCGLDRHSMQILHRRSVIGDRESAMSPDSRSSCEPSPRRAPVTTGRRACLAPQRSSREHCQAHVATPAAKARPREHRSGTRVQRGSVGERERPSLGLERPAERGRGSVGGAGARCLGGLGAERHRHDRDQAPVLAEECDVERDPHARHPERRPRRRRLGRVVEQHPVDDPQVVHAGQAPAAVERDDDVECLPADVDRPSGQPREGIPRRAGRGRAGERHQQQRRQERSPPHLSPARAAR